MQAGLLLVVEAWHVGPRRSCTEDPEGIGDRRPRPAGRSGRPSTTRAVRAAWVAQREWQATLERVFADVDILVTPTLTIFPPSLEDGDDLLVSRCTLPVNLAGVPALRSPGADGRAAARPASS